MRHETMDETHDRHHESVGERVEEKLGHALDEPRRAHAQRTHKHFVRSGELDVESLVVSESVVRTVDDEGQMHERRTVRMQGERPAGDDRPL